MLNARDEPLQLNNCTSPIATNALGWSVLPLKTSCGKIVIILVIVIVMIIYGDDADDDDDTHCWEMRNYIWLVKGEPHTD